MVWMLTRCDVARGLRGPKLPRATAPRRTIPRREEMSAREYWAAEAAKRQRVPISGGGGESRAGAEGALMAAGALHSHLQL